uniref:Cytoplasmic dynein 2 light intermediate chain 1 n=1 Tax=Schistocephalus solidus TaxID=70667 RepID=A0A183SRU4_SCHSO
LEKDENPKPTLALEYNFARKSLGPYVAKSVAHIWELGGGPKLSNLLDVTVSKDSIENLCYIVVVDLSSPKELWVNLMHFLSSYEARIMQVLERISIKSKENLRHEILAKAQARIDEKHIDRELMNIFPVSLIIIGSKYDEFLKQREDDRKLITLFLRFLAHYHGGALFFTSTSDPTAKKRIGNYLSHIAFGTPIAIIPPITQDKALHILPGQDSFALIGFPPLDKELRMGSEKSPLTFWQSAFCQKFPQVALPLPNESGLSAKYDPALSKQFAEPQVDSVRQSKDDELERYRRQSERSMREQLKQAAADGLIFV